MPATITVQTAAGQSLIEYIIAGGPPISGGCTPVGIQNARVTLTASQIRNCFTTPVQLVPAPGANLMIFPITYVAQYNFVTTGYSSPSLFVGMGTTQAALNANNWFIAFNNGDLQQTSNKIQQVAAKSPFDVLPASMTNLPLSVTSTGNMSSDPGDGTLTFNVQYLVINITTGAIVGGNGNGIWGSMTSPTNSQIKNSFTTPIQLVPAPTGNQAIIPLTAVVKSHYGGTPSVLRPDGIIGFGTTQANIAQTNIITAGGADFGDTKDDIEQDTNSDYANHSPSLILAEPLSIYYASAFSTDPWNGTAVFYVQYMIVDLGTGAIVQGSGDFFDAFTNITTAQLKADTTVPVVLTTAPGTNILNIIEHSMVRSNFNTTAFTGADAAIQNGTTVAQITGSNGPLIYYSGGTILDKTFTTLSFGQANSFNGAALTDTINQPVGWVGTVNISGQSGNATADVFAFKLDVDMTTGLIVSKSCA